MNTEQLMQSEGQETSASKKLKLVYLPRNKNDNNPYQAQLEKNLIDLGLDAMGVPYRQWFLFAALREWKADIIHFHWLQSFFVRSSLAKSLFSMVLFVFQLAILRLLGTKIVWTVHNLKNHNNRHVISERWGKIIVSRIAHGIIAHCHKAKEEIIDCFNVTDPEKIFVVPHGNYIESYENAIDRSEARRQLNIEESETVLLFFGLIRPYKGVLELIETIEKLDCPQVRLLVVGKLWQDAEEFNDILQQKAANNLQIDYRPGFVPDEMIQVYMNASDLVVFPYRDILTSGAVLLAMSFGKGCIAPKIGCIGETLDDNGAFLYDLEEADGLATAISRAVSNPHKLGELGKYNYQQAKENSWRNVARKTLAVYQQSQRSTN